MRFPVVVLLVLLLLGFVAFSQSSPSPLQSAPTDPRSVALQAVAAFSGVPVSQIQLSGTATAYAGSSQPSGTFSATLKATGESTLQLNLAELSRTETTGAYSSVPQCQWTGSNGVQHDAALHNCLLPVHWVIPVLALETQAAKLNLSVTAATDQDVAVQALSLIAAPINGSASAQKVAQLSSANLSLDATTMLSTSLSFKIHPDKDENTDIPIIVRYSDYRLVNGASIPFHIQKFLNNGLVLDLEVTNVEVQ